jgi:hypothetical protein
MCLKNLVMKKPLGIPKCRWEDNRSIVMDLKKTNWGCGGHFFK